MVNSSFESVKDWIFGRVNSKIGIFKGLILSLEVLVFFPPKIAVLEGLILSFESLNLSKIEVLEGLILSLIGIFKGLILWKNSGTFLLWKCFFFKTEVSGGLIRRFEILEWLIISLEGLILLRLKFWKS